MRSKAGSTIVLQKDITKLMEFYGPSSPPILDVAEPLLSAQGYTREVGDLSQRSSLRFLEGSASLHGSFVGYRNTPRSQVIASPFVAFMKLHRMTTDFTSAVLNGYRPWRIAALDMVNPVSTIDQGVIRSCGDSYLKHIMKNVPIDAIKHMVEPIDNFSAINGVHGVAFMDGIKRGTSAGAPFNESKRKHLTKETPQRGLDDPVGISPLIAERLANFEAKARSGICCNPVFTAHLKDEAVSKKKHDIGKTRVFCGAPLDWSIMVRKCFLGHVRLMQNYKFEFECGVGTVAQSAEWTKLFDHVTKYGVDRIVAGDYKAYDKRMPPQLMIESFRVLIELAKQSGNFSDEEILALWTVAFDTAYPLVDFNGDLVTFWGSNPSGHPLTVIINSIANSLYMRYAYASSGHDVDNFSDDVSLMTYGDDNIMSVREECEGFNHTIIQKELAKVDITYTMADKEAESVPFINIFEASFLKREWLWNDVHKVYTAPLDEKSIIKMLCVIVKSKTVTLNEQLTDIIRSAHEEWWYHGPSVFAEKDAVLRELITHHKLDAWFVAYPIPSSENYWDKFHACSKKTDFLLKSVDGDGESS